MIFNANDFARAWLSVQLASGPAKDVPVLARTVYIEEYPYRGVRLVATDRYMILTSWVPFADAEEPNEPDLAEAPDRGVIAADLDSRGTGLMAYLVALTKDAEGPEGLEVHLRFDVRHPTDDLETAPTLDGMEPTYVVLDVIESERVYLPVVDDVFPEWRGFVSGFKGASTNHMALRPSIVARLAKLEKWHLECPLVWYFGGENKVARVELGKSEPAISGMVMPVRWELPDEEAAE